jgi:protein-S-isoprenylcysteine O-methyltransferase Ste14
VNRASASLGSVVFFFVAPVVVAGVIPWWITRWRTEPSFLDAPAIRVVGAILVVFGLVVVADSFARFALEGIGTPAPPFPTRHLVVTGFYRRVRNPMYVAVVAMILGQALLFASLGLLVYGAVTWLCTHAFVVGYEEPTLRNQFGREYEIYRANVPRWLPRARPWHAPDPS